MAGEFKHKDVNISLERYEWEGTNYHELDSGVEGDFIYWDATALEFKRIAHATDLDAHTRNMFQTLRTGMYHDFWYGGADAPTALTANVMYAVPLIVTRNVTVDRIAVFIVTADAGKVARLGIYNDGANLYPGDLLLDGGEISVANNTTTEALVINQALTKGIYWAVILSDGVPQPQKRGRSSSAPLGVNPTNFGYQYGGWDRAQAYGALPDPFTAGGALEFDSSIDPRICLRVASLD